MNRAPRSGHERTWLRDSCRRAADRASAADRDRSAGACTGSPCPGRRRNDVQPERDMSSQASFDGEVGASVGDSAQEVPIAGVVARQLAPLIAPSNPAWSASWELEGRLALEVSYAAGIDVGASTGEVECEKTGALDAAMTRQGVLRASPRDRGCTIAGIVEKLIMPAACRRKSHPASGRRPREEREPSPHRAS